MHLRSQESNLEHLPSLYLLSYYGMDPVGIEPTTSCVRSRRSSSRTSGPYRRSLPAVKPNWAALWRAGYLTPSPAFRTSRPCGHISGRGSNLTCTSHGMPALTSMVTHRTHLPESYVRRSAIELPLHIARFLSIRQRASRSFASHKAESARHNAPCRARVSNKMPLGGCHVSSVSSTPRQTLRPTRTARELGEMP